MSTETLEVSTRPAEVVMDPRRLGALQPTRLSAARSIYAKLTREGWQIDLVESEVNELGAGQMLYRINANGHIMHLVAFSYEPKLVDRSPRIIGSSWDVEGALIDGEVTAADIEQTKVAIPRLYAGRATAETLIWFRANRSIRLFDHVVESLVTGQQPDLSRIAEVGYLLRNTGLDGNGTFGTKDFQEYGKAHPLGVPFHAQLFTAFMMREISIDLVNAMAQRRLASAAQVDATTRATIAVGNGSALGLVLLTMNRPQIVNAWIEGYEKLAASVTDQLITESNCHTIIEKLDQVIAYKDTDKTNYGVFPTGEALAVDLRVVRRALLRLTNSNRFEGDAFTLGDVLTHIPASILPEAVEMYRSLLIELAPEEEVEARLQKLFVSERKQVDPRATLGDLRAQIDAAFSWTATFPEAPQRERSRIWYKSRNSEEPRSGPSGEVPEDTNDLAIDLLSQISNVRSLLTTESADTRVGSFVARHPMFEQTVGYIQNLADLPYAVPHMDVRDANFVPAHIIRLFNGFCFGLDKTHDVHQRNLRGLIFEGAHSRTDLDQKAADWRWDVQR